MADSLANLLSGGFGAVLGVLLGAQAVSGRIRAVRERIDATVKDPSIDTAAAAALELAELEREAKSMIGLAKALFGRR
jgi:hypothetical protein